MRDAQGRKIVIANSEEFSAWLHQRTQVEGHPVVAIKGPPPEGACYSDDEPLKLDINVAWQDQVTGERFILDYQFVTEH